MRPQSPDAFGLKATGVFVWLFTFGCVWFATSRSGWTRNETLTTAVILAFLASSVYVGTIVQSEGKALHYGISLKSVRTSVAVGLLSVYAAETYIWVYQEGWGLGRYIFFIVTVVITLSLPSTVTSGLSHHAAQQAYGTGQQAAGSAFQQSGIKGTRVASPQPRPRGWWIPRIHFPKALRLPKVMLSSRKRPPVLPSRQVEKAKELGLWD